MAVCWFGTWMRNIWAKQLCGLPPSRLVSQDSSRGLGLRAGLVLLTKSSLRFTYCLSSFVPCTNSDALPAEQRHAAAIAAVMTVPAATSATTALTSEAAFQVVTVDEVGGLRTWTGMFAAKAQFEGSLTDLGEICIVAAFNAHLHLAHSNKTLFHFWARPGMAPGARIKLAPSSQLQAFVRMG